MRFLLRAAEAVDALAFVFAVGILDTLSTDVLVADAVLAIIVVPALSTDAVVADAVLAITVVPALDTGAIYTDDVAVSIGATFGLLDTPAANAVVPVAARLPRASVTPREQDNAQGVDGESEGSNHHGATSSSRVG